MNNIIKEEEEESVVEERNSIKMNRFSRKVEDFNEFNLDFLKKEE